MKESYNFNRMDPELEERIEGLLKQMTLSEKVGQLVMDSPYANLSREEFTQQILEAQKKGIPFKPFPKLDPAAGNLIREGRLSAVICDDPGFVNLIQRIAVEESRLHIPLLIGADVIHGYRTTFPIPLAEACTWNPELLERAARAAAVEASTMGIRWIFAPMIDIARDPRWGRIAEGGGEDPFLGRALARARVRGFQSNNLPGGARVSACPKHYAAYGGAEGGRDYNTVDISERTLRDVYLPPFKAAFDEGAGSTMASFNEIGGVPASASSFLLRKVLKDEWDWHGVVVSDYNAVGELVRHGVAKDLRDAARLAILAGVDIDMGSKAYMNHLVELVEARLVPEEIVDEAARRVLRLKLQLGLFEDPYLDETLHERYILAPEFRDLALEAARQSMVLLKNENDLLPLKAGKQRVALIGPLADNRSDLLGTWAAAGRQEDAGTVLEGFRTYLDDDSLIFVEGCSIQDEQKLDLQASMEAARQADVVVLVLGESRDLSGEARSRVHLGLPGRQQELVDTLSKEGKPLVVVVMSGRPLVIPELAQKADALLAAWHGGICAGQAVADILFGTVNPSGKLTASWPRAEGQIPVYYAHKATGRPEESAGTTQFKDPFRSIYIDEPNAPLFSFGMGLSYTQFEYSNLEVLTPSVPMDGVLKVRAAVRNAGSQSGVEIVQLYIRDLVGSVTRPMRELKGFERVPLQPGEERQVEFSVPVSELGFHNPEMLCVVEPGWFKVWVGADSTGGLESEFEVR